MDFKIGEENRNLFSSEFFPCHVHSLLDREIIGWRTRGITRYFLCEIPISSSFPFFFNDNLSMKNNIDLEYLQLP